jgi:hypothetical protein
LHAYINMPHPTLVQNLPSNNPSKLKVKSTIYAAPNLFSHLFIHHKPNILLRAFFANAIQLCSTLTAVIPKVGGEQSWVE